MTIRRKLLASAALALALSVQYAAAEEPRIVIEAIIDNGGTVMEEGAQQVIHDFVAGLANLRGRELAKARIDLILTSNPTTVWSGTPRDLIAQGQAILDLVTLNDRCSDVGRALARADQNLRVAAAEEAYLVIYSPMIFAPFPCDEGPGITLPQPVANNVAIGRLIDERHIRALKILGVHPSQEPVWTDYLVAEGILTRAREGRLDFTFLGFQQSKTFLARGKLIERSEP